MMKVIACCLGNAQEIVRDMLTLCRRAIEQVLPKSVFLSIIYFVYLTYCGPSTSVKHDSLVHQRVWQPEGLRKRIHLLMPLRLMCPSSIKLSRTASFEVCGDPMSSFFGSHAEGFSSLQSMNTPTIVETFRETRCFAVMSPKYLLKLHASLLRPSVAHKEEVDSRKTV